MGLERALVLALGAALAGCAPVATPTPDAVEVAASVAAPASTASPAAPSAASTVAATTPVGLAAAGASSTGLEAYAAQLAKASTGQLCATIARAGIAEQTRLMVEAELGVRGVEACEGTPIGAVSAAQVGVPRYARAAPAADGSGQDLHNCGDFASAAQAQRAFLASGGPAFDPHDLDRDGDGAACEWGTELRRIASRPARVRPAPILASPRCYTGPRGGTYTITSGGVRDYDGC